jgi:putative phosphoribosyl transferase
MEPFKDLRSAGQTLASSLEHLAGVEDTIVLGLVSGGVPVAREVALKLSASMDLVTIRRLLMPRGPGSQVCAVDVAGTLVLDDQLPPVPTKPESPIDHFLSASIAELEQRARVCRGDRPAVALKAKTIVLVDCGIRSGSTMQAAIGALRTRSPRRIIVAVPVASSSGKEIVEKIADDYFCNAHPEPFVNAGAWYKDFTRPPDEQLARLIPN